GVNQFARDTRIRVSLARPILSTTRIRCSPGEPCQKKTSPVFTLPTYSLFTNQNSSSTSESTTAENGTSIFVTVVSVIGITYSRVACGDTILGASPAVLRSFRSQVGS